MLYNPQLSLYSREHTTSLHLRMLMCSSSSRSCSYIFPNNPGLSGTRLDPLEQLLGTLPHRRVVLKSLVLDAVSL